MGDGILTEKRFTLKETDWSYRIRDDGAIMKILKIVELLNAQHERLREKDELLIDVLRVNESQQRALVDIERVCDKYKIKLLRIIFIHKRQKTLGCENPYIFFEYFIILT